jgi:hypothetical protein
MCSEPRLNLFRGQKQIGLRLAPALGVLPLTGDPFRRQRLPEPLHYYSSGLLNCKGLLRAFSVEAGDA